MSDTLILVNNEPNITINNMRKSAALSHLFYPQDWYWGERFADMQLPKGEHTFYIGDAMPMQEPYAYDVPFAVACVWAYVQEMIRFQRMLWHDTYVWCRDIDYYGDQVYVGGAALGRTKGIQIHRHIKLKPHHTTMEYRFTP